MKLPKCLGHYDYGWEAPEFDCDYPLSGEIDCSYCLCNYYKLGGLVHPATGKTIPKIIAFILYGSIEKEGKV